MLEPSYGPRNTEADRPTYDLEVTDGSERQIAGSFSSGGCCENGVDGYALIALLAGKISFLDNIAYWQAAQKKAGKFKMQQKNDATQL